MKINRRSLSRYVCFLLCFFFISTSVPVSAMAQENVLQTIEETGQKTEKNVDQQTEQKTVRVGWYEDSYHITGANGERSGYGYEYEQAVAAYTGWNYEYIKGDWSELLEMLQKGEIDLMAALSYTEERAQTMLFSELPMGEEKYYLYADLTDPEISASDLSTLNGKKIVAMEKSVQATQFSEWEEKNNVKTQHVNCNSFEKAKALAEKHEIDGVISTETPAWVEAGMSAIANTGGSGIYYGINKKRPDLKQELDNAMRKMEYDKPFYADELYQRYLSAQSVAVVSSEEDAWLKEYGAIRIGFLKYDPGVSVFDPETGDIVGVINDYIKYASDCLKKHELTFELEGFDTQEAEMQALKDGRIDMIFHASQNPNASEDNGFALSNTVWTFNLAALTLQGQFNEEGENIIAVAKDNYALKWYITYNYPRWKMIEYDTLADAEKAVHEGKADGFILRASQVTNYMKDNKLYTTFLMKPDNTSFAVKRGNTMLLSILNKTLKTMPSSMLTGALSMYDNVSRKVTVMDFMRDNLVAVTSGLVSSFLLILLVILGFLRKSRIAEEKAKQAASQSQELNKKLQESHCKLEEALERAEKANTAKTTFLNNMSHDIRTPMNAIIGFTNIALHQNVSDVVKNCLEKISDSSELLLTLINDVLDISRIESGHVKISPMVVDITEVTGVALNVMSGLLAHRNIKFQVERIKPENPYVYADSVRIREILVNILGNAAKFTEDGGTICFISDYKPDSDGKHLLAQYVISDTGIGMSEEFQKHIFDEFSQENSDARTKYKGTGLGMAITKHYVDLMGGKISVKSEKNKGSKFTIELPLEIAGKEDIPEKEKTVNISDVTGTQVLLAEDNDLNAEIAVIQLEEAGMKVTRAADGKQALDLFKENPAGTFDVILMDIMMPKMNGYEATAAIRSLPDRPDGQTIPIIALTANAFAEDVQTSIEAGMNGHLSKPIAVDVLIKMIVKNLDRV